MKKKILSAVLILTVFLSMPAVKAQSAVLIINNSDELYQFAEDVNSGNDYDGMTIILNADIYLNESLFDSSGNLNIENPVEWIPIGTEQRPFKGMFDGNGHSVCGIYVNKDSNFGGLFGVISNATVKNLNIKDSYIYTPAHSGSVVGFANANSVISFCHNSGGKIYATNGRSGGIVGWTDWSDVYNCSNSGYVFSDRCSGGIVGDVYTNSKIYNCENTGVVDGYQLLGGISGGTTDADIKNCLNVGELKSGYHMAGGPGTRSITNCFAYKNEEFNSHIGGDSYTFDNVQATLGEAVSINGQNYTKVVDILNAFKATIDNSVTLATWSHQSNEFPSLCGAVEKPSKTTILDYDTESKTAIIYPSVDGKYMVVFADYDENGKLNYVDLVEHTFTAGIYSEIQQEDISFTLSGGDKIMIWTDTKTLKPFCEGYIMS